MARINDYADRSLKPTETREMVRRYKDRSGRSRICGGADLKASQAYPPKLLGSHDLPYMQPPTDSPRFGVAMSKLRTRFKKQHKLAALRFLRRARKSESDFGSSLNNRDCQFWSEHADLEPVFAFLLGK